MQPDSPAPLIFTPAEIPRDARIRIVGSTTGRLEEILRIVRPDVTIGPDEPLTVHVGPEALANPPLDGLVLPECPTADYDWWSFALTMLDRDERGLFVRKDAMIEHLQSFGGFFGKLGPNGWIPEPVRYRAYERPRPPKVFRAEVDDLLADDASRADLATVLDSSPEEVWAHWLGQFYSGLEYMDYATVSPGDVVVNCGVGGGGEIPYFLAGMRGDGVLINVEPMKPNYYPYVQQALAAFPGDVHEVTAAMHHVCGEINLPVERTGGMAIGGLVNRQVDGTDLVAFEAVTLDALVDRFHLSRLDLVKTDMEGAEPSALKGGIESIRWFRPQLAISIYHELRHFTDIPRYLASELTGYRYFLRHYHLCSNETILYAIPEERPVRARAPLLPVALV